MNENPKLIVIGSVAFDTIATPFGSAENVLGGSASYFSLAAGYFTEPGLVAVVGDDFPAESQKLFESKKIDVAGLARQPGKTFRWGGKYNFDLNTRETLFTELNVFEKFNPVLPESYKACEYLFLGNITPALQENVLAQTPAVKFAGLDTMNFWIDKDKAGLLSVLQKINALIINDEEARELSAEYNLVKAAKKIIGMMAEEKSPVLIIKQGEHGLLMFQGKNFFNLPGYPLEEVFDPTGAGDSFAGGFMGYIAAEGKTDWESLKRACAAGSVMASFCVEKMGTAGLLDLSADNIKKRLEAFKALTEFELF